MPRTFLTEQLFLNLSDNAPSLFVHHSCVPELIMVVFKRLNCFNLLLFIISLTEVRLIPVFFSTSLGDMLLPGFSSCEQISAKWHQLMRRWKSLWIKNLRVFKQYNELNRRMKSLQCKIRRRRKKQILMSILCKWKTRRFLKNIIYWFIINFRFLKFRQMIKNRLIANPWKNGILNFCKFWNINDLFLVTFFMAHPVNLITHWKHWITVP